jgi:hypothetical protein
MKTDQPLYCSYFQARVKREECWLLTSTLRSFEHISFDRTIDKATSTFEFFVPAALESYFLKVMAYYEKIGLISDFVQLPNRLMDEQAQL